jgi:tetratricopeptide (TPR) repeat protein
MNQNRNTLLLSQSLLLVFFYVTSINSSLAAKAKAPLAGAKSKPYYESPKSHFVNLLAGLPTCSLEQLTKSIAAKPHKAMPYIQRGQALLAGGEDAEDDFKKALSLEPKSALSHIAMSRWYQSQQQWPQAFAELQTATHLSSDEVANKALWESAFLHREQKDYSIANKQYEELLKRTKNNQERASVLFEKGETLCRDGKYKLALECCEQALKLNSNLIDAYACRGLALSQLGKINEGIADLSRVIGLEHSADPPPPHLLTAAYTMRSNLYKVQGKTDLARRDQSRSLSSQAELLNEMPFRSSKP